MAIRPEDELNQEQDTMNVLGDEQQTQQPEQQEQQAPSQPISVSGGATQVGSESAGVKQSDKSPASSGLFTNIRKFMQANKGAGQKIADTAKQKVGTSAQDVGQAIAQKKQEFKDASASAAGTLTQQQQQAQQAIKTAGTQQYGKPTDEQVQQFRGIATGQSLAKGPEFNIQQQQQQAQDINRQAEAAQTSQGRFGLLREFFAKPDKQYGRGLQKLDTAFLQQDPTARQDIATGLKDIASKTQADIAGASSFAEQETGALANQAQTVQDTIQGQLTDAQKQVELQALKRGQLELAKRQGLIDRYNQAVEETGDLSTLSQEDKQALGLIDTQKGSVEDITGGSEADLQKAIELAKSQGIVRGFEDISLQDYLRGGQQLNLTEDQIRQKFASEQEAERSRALARLAGRSAEEAGIVAAGAGVEGPSFDIESAQTEISKRVDSIVNDMTGGDIEYMADKNPGFNAAFNAPFGADHAQALLAEIAPELSGRENIAPLIAAYQAKSGQIPQSWIREDYSAELNPGASLEQKLKPQRLEQIKYGNQVLNTLSERSGGYLSSMSNALHESSKRIGKNYLRRQAIEAIKKGLA